MNQNIIVIDLKSTKSVNDILDLLKVNKLMSLDAKKLFASKQNGYLKVFIDDKTFDTIAFVHKDDKSKIKPTKSYLANLAKLESISLDVINTNESIENLSIDDILDKISLSGLNSLTKSEKNFLSENSKK